MRNSTITSKVYILYFKHQDLTRIHGEPTLNALHSMVLHLKVNTTSVPTTFDNGAHGYDGAILSSITHITLAPLAPFVIPTHPDPLNLAIRETQYVISNTQTVHGENLPAVTLVPEGFNPTHIGSH